jgi:hypothetical protein
MRLTNNGSEQAIPPQPPSARLPVLLNIDRMPDIVSIKVGSFDDTSWFKPKLNIWTDSAQAWLPEIANCQNFAKNSG